VTGLCIPPSPTPTETPTPTDTPVPTETPSPTPTATLTPTPSPTPTPKGAYIPVALREAPPKPLYIPLALGELCQPKQQRVDVALVLDTSSSMGEPTRAGRSKLVAAQAAARAFLDELQFAAGDQAALVTFNEAAQLAQPLTGDRVAAETAIAAMTLAPLTCLVCGIERADEELRSARHLADHTPVMIVLTDGRSNPRPKEDAIAAAAVAKAAGVMIFTIGIGEDLDLAALALIANRPDFFYRTADAEELDAIYRAIAVAIPCQPDAYWGRR